MNRTTWHRNIKIVFVKYSYNSFYDPSFSGRYNAIVFELNVSEHIMIENYVLLPPVLVLLASSFFGQSHMNNHGHCLFASYTTLQSWMDKLQSENLFRFSHNRGILSTENITTKHFSQRGRCTFMVVSTFLCLLFYFMHLRGCPHEFGIAGRGYLHSSRGVCIAHKKRNRNALGVRI